MPMLMTNPDPFNVRPFTHRTTNKKINLIVTKLILVNSVFIFLTQILHRWRRIGSNQGRSGWGSKWFCLFGLQYSFLASWSVLFYLSKTDSVRLQGEEGQPEYVSRKLQGDLDVLVYCELPQIYREGGS